MLGELTSLRAETEWVEFKQNLAEPEKIGEYLSALSNSAALHDKDAGFLVWGVEDKTHRIVGTSFDPRTAKGKGNEPLESWLLRLLEPKIDLRIHTGETEGEHVVVIEVPAARDRPVAFKGVEFIRAGSVNKKLRDLPEKERRLWIRSQRVPFESEIALRGGSSGDVLALLDYSAYFDMTRRRLPDSPSAILDGIEAEGIISRCGDGTFHITNLGAILFAGDLREFSSVARKAVRVIQYDGTHRAKTLREQEGQRGYACGFKGLVKYINDQLPHNELIEESVRREAPMYPEIAVRELIANMLIHQDFSVSGAGPMVEIFSDRIEMTNPGDPLIDVRRFLDLPPRSRNEGLAALMRRMGVCEERGSGIDKVLFEVELYQLPAPDFVAAGANTRAVLYSPRKLSKMRREDRVRACYQHAALRYVVGEEMTNASLRQRFKLSDTNHTAASRIISETIKSGLVKTADPGSRSRKHASYVPFWA